MRNLTLFFFLLLASQLIAQPSSEGLVCWFPFNGNANDESIFGHVVVVNGPILTTDRHGNLNSAYFFDGIDDFIQVVDHSALRLGNTSFTISAWIYPEAINDLQSHAVLSKRTGSGNQGYLFQLIGSEHVMDLGSGTFDIITSGGWDDPKLTTNEQLSVQGWHHVFYCYDSDTSTGQFFIDGQQDINGPMVDANGMVQGDLFIGKDKLTDGNEYPKIAPGYVGGFHFYGKIDDIRIYNRKLTHPERNELYREITTGINGQSDKFSVTIHPDPVSDFLKINTQSIDIHAIKVHDILGRLVFYGVFSNELDCRSFAAGGYLISFIDKNGRQLLTEKFIKL